MVLDTSRFGILTDNETPRKVFILENRNVVLRDEHSGLKVSTNVKIPSTSYSVSDFVDKVKSQID